MKGLQFAALFVVRLYRLSAEAGKWEWVARKDAEAQRKNADAVC